MSTIVEGSPPHTRGILIHYFLNNFNSGITPAYAGNTFLLLYSFLYLQDHPRIRGEYIFRIFLIFTQQGSPPHTRGIPKADL